MVMVVVDAWVGIVVEVEVEVGIEVTSAGLSTWY